MASPDRLKPIELGVSSSSPLRAPYCLYEIDAEDRIVRCDEGWDAAAAEYGAPENASDHVRGRVLWSIFSDPATESIHRKAVSSLREHGVTSTIAYRCDLPAERRAYEVEVGPGEERGSVRFTVNLLRQEPRPAVEFPPFGPGFTTNFARVEGCSFCSRLDIGGVGPWVELETAIAMLDREPAHPWVTFTVCPDCQAAASAATGIKS